MSTAPSCWGSLSASSSRRMTSTAPSGWGGLSASEFAPYFLAPTQADVTFIGAQNIWVLFIIYLWLTPGYYNMKMGAPEDRPEFNKPTW